MIFEYKQYNAPVSEEALLADIKAVAKSLGKTTLSIAEYYRSGRFKNINAAYRLGGWNKALIEAGLEIKKIAVVSRAELIDNLEKVWLELGRQPRAAEMRPPLSKYSIHPYQRVFGSWNNALKTVAEIKNRDAKRSYEVEIFKRGDAKPSNARTKKRGRKRGRSPNPKLRLEVFKRDKFRCVMCGASPARNPQTELVIDHIIPWSKGGETVLENLQTLCSKCNAGKGDD